MSTTQLQLRRGNSSQVAAFCGAEGELVYDTTNKHLRVHDGHKNAQDEYDHTGMIIPNRDEVVRKTGSVAETITGVKTFTSEPIITNATNINIFNQTVTKGTQVANTTYWGLEATANPATVGDTSWQGRRIGKLEWALNTNDITSACLYAVKNEGAVTTSAYIGAYYDTTNNIGYTKATKTPNDTTTNNNYIVTSNWVNDSASGVNNLVHKSGTETIDGTKTFSSKIYASGGVQGTASSALWADLAEQYQSDKEYPVGTLISFGGEKDITIAKVECHGVISDKPGFLLDCGLENSLPVALVGKTPVRVIGKIKKFDRIVLSDIPGVGKEQTTSDEKIIAIALEDNDNTEEKLVMSVVKVSF